MPGKVFLIVSGLPGSGKSTVAREVASFLGWPLIDKDVILESRFDSSGRGSREQRTRHSRASDGILLEFAAEQDRAVLVNWWDHDRAPGQLSALDGVLVEMHCACPVRTAAERFSQRRRHPGHLDPELTPGEIETRIAHIQASFRGPLRLGGPLLTVETTEPVDSAALGGRIRELIGATPASGDGPCTNRAT